MAKGEESASRKIARENPKVLRVRMYSKLETDILGRSRSATARQPSPATRGPGSGPHAGS
jgi:hypothetical protein